MAQQSKRARTTAPDPTLELDEDALREVDAELQEMRDEWRSTHGAMEQAMEHFKLEFRGGRWTKTHKHVAVDSCRGVSSSMIGSRFLQHWALPKTFLCTFNLYTRSVSQVLCHAWCHRMTYFARLWLEDGLSDGFVFTAEHARDHREPVELAAPAAEWPPESAAARRLAQLRAISPLGVGCIAADVRANASGDRRSLSAQECTT